MSRTIGGIDVTSSTNGYYHWEIEYGGPVTGVAEVSGRRVLIPGSPGFYTPDATFEERHLVIGIKGHLAGTGATHALAVASFASRFAALRTACDVANRDDITIEWDGWTISAGFLRFEHPPLYTLGAEGMDLLIEFDATNPPEWAAS